jgi:hypothetical protein
LPEAVDALYSPGVTSGCLTPKHAEGSSESDITVTANSLLFVIRIQYTRRVSQCDGQLVRTCWSLFSSSI